MSKRLVVRSIFDCYTGYGQLSSAVVMGLQDYGIRVYVVPMNWDTNFGGPPLRVAQARVQGDPVYQSELLIHLPSCSVPVKKNRVQFTMWEASRIEKAWVENMNKRVGLCVPNEWNLNCFSACGVDTPMYPVPLFVDPIYQFSDPARGNVFVLGCGGRTAHGGCRKGIEEVVDLFLRAFPDEKDVRLRVKIWGDCNVPKREDERVEYIREYLTTEQMFAWYRSLNCFVSASLSEGWGLMQHQAMMCGRPVISTRFSGTAEFMEEDNSFVVRHRYAAVRSLYSGQGVWAEPDEDDMIAKMRIAYGNRKLVEEKGWRAHVRVRRYTIQNMVERLVKVLEKHRVIME